MKKAIHEIAEEGRSRPQVIEEAVIEHLERRRRAQRNARDLEILNRHADRLNREIEDILAYQVER